MPRPIKRGLASLASRVPAAPRSSPNLNPERESDHQPLDPDCPCADCEEYAHDPSPPADEPCGCIECDPDNFADDDDDDDATPEATGGAVQSNGVAAVANGAAGLPAFVSAPPVPPAAGDGQTLVPAFLPADPNNPWEFPVGADGKPAAYARLSRVVNGKLAPCKFKMPDGRLGERIGPTELSTDAILHCWGRGEYVVQFHGADGKFMGKRRPVELVDGVDKPLVFVPPAPPAPPPVAPTPPPAAHVPTAPDPMSLLAAVGNPAVAQNPLALFVAFKQFFDADTEARLARERRDADARVERLRYDQQMSLLETQERHRRMMDEDRARHARDLEHQAQLSRSLIESSADARRRRDLEEEIDELRQRVTDAPGPESQGVIGQFMAAAAPLIPLAQSFLASQQQQAAQQRAQQHAAAVAARAPQPQEVAVRDVTGEPDR